MADEFGLTALGLKIKQLQTIKTEIQTSLQGLLGLNLNFLPESVFGNIVGVFSEREALLWQVIEALYNSRRASGAEGIAVDDLLALTNDRRLPASASVTDPNPLVDTGDITKYGLVLLGTPATVVPATSIIQTDASPSTNFTLDEDVTIGAAVNAVQTLFFSNTPTSGNFALYIDGGVTPTANIPYTAIAAVVQAAINGLVGYEDATVSGTFGTGFAITYAASLAATPIQLATVASNTLQNGIVVTNIRVVNTAQGHPAQGVGSATAAVTGPVSAPAGTLTIIGTPVSGWTGVTNQLDVLPGSDVEDDVTALLRRLDNLGKLARGPIEALNDKVSGVKNVTDVIVFENKGISALQKITFDQVPDAGSFKIIIGSGITSAILYTATSATVQTAIRAISGLSDAEVSGDFTYGFMIDPKSGGKYVALSLAAISTNTLTKSSAPIVVTPVFERPGKSIEVVVSGGTDAAVGQAIYNAHVGGVETFGTTTENVFDEEDNLVPVSFSRPTEVPIYVDIVLTTDLLTAAVPEFNPEDVQKIQDKIIDIGNKVGIGGLIIGLGSNGLVGAFNDVPGIISYTLNFGRSPSPVSNANIQLLPDQLPVFETFNVVVSYT